MLLGIQIECLIKSNNETYKRSFILLKMMAFCVSKLTDSIVSCSFMCKLYITQDESFFLNLNLDRRDFQLLTFSKFFFGTSRKGHAFIRERFSFP